jgi:hypothetical protein
MDGGGGAGEMETGRAGGSNGGELACLENNFFSVSNMDQPCASCQNKTGFVDTKLKLGF